MSMKVTDPVCGCMVFASPYSRRHCFRGSDFYFCSDACMTCFMQDPARYLGAATVRSGA